MKAYVLHGVNDLRYEDIPIPSCPAGWGLVKVYAAGICSSDIPRIMKKGTYHFPTVPGHEFSGTVEAVGDASDQQWIGRRVGVFPLIPCRKCSQCKEGHFEMCRNYDYSGSRRDGGFAEYVAVPIWNMILLPENVTYRMGAMLEPFAVALHAVRRVENICGKRVAVIGTGMIGIAAAKWAKIWKAAEVFVIGRGEEKRRLVEEKNGLTYINGDEGNFSEDTDIVIEAVGTQESIMRAIGNVRPGGQIILIGNPEGDIFLNQDIYWQILRKQLCLSGTWNSSFGENGSDWEIVINAVKKGMINFEELISHSFDQEKLKEGIRLMAGHQEPYCKVMTLWGEKS